MEFFSWGLMLDDGRLAWKQAFISVFQCLKNEVEILFVFDQLWGIS
jgi:hypothetical protein